MRARRPIDSELGVSLSLGERAHGLDSARREALARIWFVSGVHGKREPLLRLLDRRKGRPPAWLVFAGDIGLDSELGTFQQWLQPVYAPRLAHA